MGSKSANIKKAMEKKLQAEEDKAQRLLKKSLSNLKEFRKDLPKQDIPDKTISEIYPVDHKKDEC